MSNLNITCTEEELDFMLLPGETDCESISICTYNKIKESRTKICINKESATNLVNHLIGVFEINKNDLEIW